MEFELQQGFVEKLIDAQEAASTAITTAFSAVTPVQTSSFAMALGPIAAANMIPAMFESTANNVASGMSTAAKHGMLGAATHIVGASHAELDTATDV